MNQVTTRCLGIAAALPVLLLAVTGSLAAGNGFGDMDRIGLVYSNYTHEPGRFPWRKTTALPSRVAVLIDKVLKRNFGHFGVAYRNLIPQLKSQGHDTASLAPTFRNTMRLIRNSDYVRLSLETRRWNSSNISTIGQRAGARYFLVCTAAGRVLPTEKKGNAKRKADGRMPRTVFSMEMMLLDTCTQNFAWYCKKSLRGDIANPAHAEAMVQSHLMNLFAQYDIAPAALLQKFPPREKMRVQIRNRRPLVGYIDSLRDMRLKLRDQRQKGVVIPLEQIVSIYQVKTNRKVYPQ